MTDERPLHGTLLYDKAQIDARISEMAREIIDNYDPRSTLFVSLLNGGLPFTAKLMHAIQTLDSSFQPNVQTMMVSRYGDSREPGETRLVSDLSPLYRELSGYQVILLDDLVDGGDTLAYARQHLLGYNAQAVDCVVLVRKAKDTPARVDIALYGFEAPDGWLTGMGMDDNRLALEANRWAEWIALSADSVYS